MNEVSLMDHLRLLIITSGLMHFAILTASALVPRVLDWHSELAKLPALLRQLVWVHGGYIVSMIVAIGTVSVLLPTELTTGSPLARSVCGFIAVFWGARLVLQLLFFEPAGFLKSAVLKLGYHSLTIAFTFLTAVYAASAVLP